MTDILRLLKKVTVLQNNHLNQLMELLRKLVPLTNEFQNKSNIDPPFNIILAASDIYYRENYHSDIMKYILDNKKHTMKHFINYINNLCDKEHIDTQNYLKTEVIREKENRIDILVKDEVSRHAIIIENKINNAGDMPGQLPRYYNTVKEKGYTVDKIIYYSMDGTKRPDTSTWTAQERLGLEKITVYGAAANETKTDFINAFLVPCKNDANDEQEKAFYCQYIDLLEYLRRRNQMDYQLMEKFYEEMSNMEQFNSALSLKEMLNDLVAYRKERIYNHFSNDYAPFEIQNNKGSSTQYLYIRDIAPDENIKIDIYTEQNRTEVLFWIQEPKIKSDLIKTILEKIGEEHSFRKIETNYYKKIFTFPEEDKALYEYMKKLFALLDHHKNSIAT